MMKTVIARVGIALLGLWAGSASLNAAQVEKVQFKGGKVFVHPGGRTLEAPEELSMPFEVVVLTNGTFTVNKGKARNFQEGDSLGADGMLTKADGSISPVMDHVSRNRGRVTIFKDGEGSEPREPVKLANGTTVTPDGKITPPSGASRTLLDGEIFKLDGGSVAARDTITLQGGRVKVQKDGSAITVEPGRSIMMNDGTKVMSDGTVIRASGSQIKLTEGQVVTIDGVATRSR